MKIFSSRGVRVVECEVQLVIQREGPIVHVGASHRRPETVHRHGLGVEQSRAVLVDLDAGVQQLTEPTPARLPDDVVVDGAGQQQDHPHPSTLRFQQGLTHLVVGQEIRIGHVDIPPGRRHGEEIHRVHREAAVAGRAPHDLSPRRAPCRLRPEVAFAAQHPARRLEPVLRESPLQIVHRRAFHTRVGLAPLSLAAAIAHPLGAGAGPPGEAHLPIHHQNTAMIAIVRLVHRPRAQRAEGRDLAAGPFQRLSQLGRHLEGAEAVEEHVSAEARPAPLTDGFHEGHRRRPVFVEVLRIGDGALSTANGGELGGEDLIAVEQKVHPIPRAHRGRRVRLHGGNKRRIGHRHLRNCEVRLHLRAGG
jgi:hypothetical protein